MTRPWRLTRRQRVEMEARVAAIRADVMMPGVDVARSLHGSILVGGPAAASHARASWASGELSQRDARVLRARVAIALRAALRADEDARCEELLGIAAGPAGDDRLREGVEAVRRLRSERDEARAQLAALRAEVSEALDLPPGIGPAPGEIARLAREHREMVMRCGEAADYMAADDVRVARAEAQLAALREAVREVLDEPHAYVGGRERAILDAALADTAAAAEAHDRRVRAEALREAADRWSDQEDDVPRWLRARADEIERGR